MSEVDSFTLLAILIRAAGYGAGLLAVGSGLYLAAYATRAFPASAPGAAASLARRTALLGAAALVLAVLLAVAGVCVRAGRLSGMGVGGMTEPMMLQIVWEGPVGRAVTVRLAGFLLLAVGLAAHAAALGRFALFLAAGVFAFSYTFVGHATEAPRWLLPAMLTIHLVAVSFWIGALAPLAIASRRLAAKDAACLLEAFGRHAVYVVATLIAAGAVFAAVLIATPAGLFGSAYGRIFLVKLAVVAVLLGLAAQNKLRLVPGLAAGDEAMRGRLARSIRLEALAVAAILLATAVLTSVATPPSHAMLGAAAS
ncbi:copper resistance D family protein [Acuticoccus sediminis]|uniref:copper resistance D family protein n=1 Tax=Acuticoccus sediminis TaxID=2184697 RepID=UPI001CFD8E13|nr:CopD family protein [Acuticoccus sediminis]